MEFLKQDKSYTTTVAGFATSTLHSLFSDRLSSAVEFSKSIPSLAKRGYAEAWRIANTKPEKSYTETATTAANFAISKLNSLFSDRSRTYAVEFAKTIPSLAKRSCVAAWRFIEQKCTEEKGKVKLVIAAAIGFVFVRFCCRCCGGGGGRVMKPPGRPGGAKICRSGFEGNPRKYFRDLRHRR